MKTLDEVITELEDEGLFADALYYLKIFQRHEERVRSQLDDLKEEYRPNDPLTWSELRQMEGKPVWTVESTVTYDDNRIERIGRWNIIREVTQEHIIFYIGLPYHKSWQGIGWQAYRKER